MGLSYLHPRTGLQQHVKLQMGTLLLLTSMFKLKVRKDQNLFSSSKMQIWHLLLFDHPGGGFTSAISIPKRDQPTHPSSDASPRTPRVHGGMADGVSQPSPTRCSRSSLLSPATSASSPLSHTTRPGPCGPPPPHATRDGHPAGPSRYLPGATGAVAKPPASRSCTALGNLLVRPLGADNPP